MLVEHQIILLVLSSSTVAESQLYPIYSSETVFDQYKWNVGRFCEAEIIISRAEISI
jgi:hypothetical protein